MSTYWLDIRLIFYPTNSLHVFCETSRFAASINSSNCIEQAVVVERSVAQAKSGLISEKKFPVIYSEKCKHY